LKKHEDEQNYHVILLKYLKIEQCFSGRYGIPSPERAAILLRLDATSPFKTLDLSKSCQEHLDTTPILHFFHEHNPEALEKLG